MQSKAIVGREEFGDVALVASAAFESRVHIERERRQTDKLGDGGKDLQWICIEVFTTQEEVRRPNTLKSGSKQLRVKTFVIILRVIRRAVHVSVNYLEENGPGGH